MLHIAGPKTHHLFLELKLSPQKLMLPALLFWSIINTKMKIKAESIINAPKIISIKIHIDFNIFLTGLNTLLLIFILPPFQYQIVNLVYH